MSLRQARHSIRKNIGYISAGTYSQGPMGSLRHLVGFRRKPRPPPSPKAIARAANRSKVLVDTWLNPPGSFSTSHYKSAREVLDVFSRARPLDLDYSHLAIFLFERIVRENATLRNNKELRWILDPRATLYPVLRIWKETRERDRGVAISPFLLVKTFQTMSEELPEFKYNEISVGRILEIVIQQSKRENAGQAALDLFDYIQNAARTPLQKYQVQSPKFYNLVINALMKSSATDAEKQIEMLIQQMHTNEVSPDLGTYQCLVKFWSDRDCVEKVDQLLAQIRDSNQFQVNGTILNEAIRCYCRIGDIGKAERALREMVDIEQQFYPTKEIETSGAWSIRRCRYDLIAHSVQNVMLAYRRRIISARILSNTDQTDAAATIWEKARTLFELRIQSHNLLDVVTTNRLVAVMMDIHNLAGKTDHENAVARYLKFNVWKHDNLSTLVKSLGRDGMVHRATDIVFRGVADPQNSPFITPKVIVSLLHAWAEDAADPDRVQEAWKVLHKYNSTLGPQTVSRSVQTKMYNALLKVILKSRYDSMGEQAQQVIDEMERLKIIPDKLSYERAVKSCILSHDTTRQREMLERMRLSAFPPDYKSFQEFHTLEKGAQNNDVDKSSLLWKLVTEM